MAALILLGTGLLAPAGTWSDHFSQPVLGSDWRGDRNYFAIVKGALNGESASPVAVSPLNLVEVGTNWSDFSIQCQINVVSPNLRVCTKGALILRHRGNEGYVFALHTATKTIEVYRLSNHETLLSKGAPLQMQEWYRVRAELWGNSMSFYVDDQLVGTVTDDRSPSGAAGVAVQDAEEVLFDDFRVTGPNVSGNMFEVLRVGEKITLAWPASFSNYVLKGTSALSPAASWTVLTNSFTASEDRLSVTLDLAPGNRFYTLTPESP